MAIEFTGERVVPGLVDINLFNEHLSRYRFAKRFAAGKRVLDAGCGSGYGAADLAGFALAVTGVDASAAAVEYARAHYAAEGLEFKQGDCTALPDGPFDLIAAFEVIEHVDDWRGFLKEANRVLAPGGMLMVSTPNKLYYAESRAGSGPNPFHAHEFEFAEFQRELSSVFPYVGMFTQNHGEGVIFAPVHGGGHVETALDGASPVPEEAHFFLAVCSREARPEPDAFVWVPSAANLLRERERHIELQAGEIRIKTAWLEQRKTEIDARNVEYGKLLERVRELNEELEQRNRWALESHTEAERRGKLVLEKQAELAQAIAEFDGIARAYENKLAELEQINREKTEWARETERRLGTELAERGRELYNCVEILHEVEKTVAERTAWAQGLDRELIECRRHWAALQNTRWVKLGRKLKQVDSQ